MECDKIAECSGALVVLAANRCFHDVIVAMPGRVIAFAEKLLVFRLRKAANMETMRSAEGRAHPHKRAPIIPNFGQEIFPLVQSDPVERYERVHPFVNVFGQTLGCHRACFERFDVAVEMTVVELATQGMNAIVDLVVAHNWLFEVHLLSAKTQARPIIVPVG